MRNKEKEHPWTSAERQLGKTEHLAMDFSSVLIAFDAVSDEHPGLYVLLDLLLTNKEIFSMVQYLISLSAVMTIY